MNRKLIVAAIGFVIAVAIGSHFYVEWQMVKFDASLPTPPTEEQQVSDETTGGHWHGDEWHAEPHADEQVEVDPGPHLHPIMLPKLSELDPGEIRYYDAAKTRPIHWRDYGGIVPDENTPRPYKHLTDYEFHTMDRSGLTPVQQVLLENEEYFRSPSARENLKLKQQLWRKMEALDRLYEQDNARALREYEERKRAAVVDR